MEWNTRIIKINPLSLAKISAMLHLAIGIVAGILFFIMALIDPTTVLGEMSGIGIFFTFLMALVFPLLYALLGFIMGIFLATVFNYSAGSVGGLVLEGEEI